MIQMGVIEIHPWGATIDHIHTPDRMIFDLDPDVVVPFSEVKQAALEIRMRLKRTGLDSFLKCTGGKGLHVVVPLALRHRWDDVKAFASAFAHQMVDEARDRYVATITKAKRKGKILIDYFRNDYTATGIAGYSLRARPGMPVAVPLAWRELETLEGGDRFDIGAVLRRIEGRQPWPELPKQRLPGKERIDVHGSKARHVADGGVARRSTARGKRMAL
jgi:bifunctional non-homologous end joining protein LigD